MKAGSVGRPRSAPLPSASEMASGEMTHARAMAALGRSRGAAPVCRITDAVLSVFRKMMQEMTETVERLDASGPAGNPDHPDDGSCLRRLLEVGQNIETHLRPAGKNGSEYMAPTSAFAPISAISKGEDAAFRPYLPDGERFIAIKAALTSIHAARIASPAADNRV